jgi:hypothetical protein
VPGQITDTEHHGADRQICAALVRLLLGQVPEGLLSERLQSAARDDQAKGCDHQQEGAGRDGVSGKSPSRHLGRHALVHAHAMRIIRTPVATRTPPAPPNALNRSFTRPLSQTGRTSSYRQIWRRLLSPVGI